MTWKQVFKIVFLSLLLSASVIFLVDFVIHGYYWLSINTAIFGLIVIFIINKLKNENGA